MRPFTPLVVAAAMLGLVAGCGPPPGLIQPSAPPAPSPTGHPTGLPTRPTHLPSAAVVTPPNASPSRFGPETAVPCRGQPGPDQILAVLRRAGMLPVGATASVTEGPLCAGDWQYAVVGATDLDPLQVVTEGNPGDLSLVTAGTNVCTVEVRVTAPPGIRTAAGCVG